MPLAALIPIDLQEEFDTWELASDEDALLVVELLGEITNEEQVPKVDKVDVEETQSCAPSG